jgi:D-alanyl-D-alanine carboxypeptidase (penicillin-binding protein 5/6)
MELISVVLASGWGDAGKQGKWSDTKALLNYGFKYFSYKEVIQQGQPAGKLSVERSRTEEVSLIYDQGFTIPLRTDERDNVQVELHVPPTVKAPVRYGDILGEAHILLSGKVCWVIPLKAIGEARRHDFKTSAEKVLGCWLGDIKIVLPEFSLPFDN